MKKIIAALFVMTFISAYANENTLDCSPKLGFESEQILKNLIDKTLIFGYRDNSIHKMLFSTNEMDVTTATYSEMRGDVIYGNMEIWECMKSGIKYLALHKDRHSQSGTYKYPVWILIGNNEGEYFALSDLRWGTFETPKIQVKK